MAKAIVAAAPGGPEVLRRQDVEVPRAGPGRAAGEGGRGRRELHRHLRAQRRVQRRLPLHSRRRGRGHGGSCRRRRRPEFTAGDRVAFAEGAGTYAEYAVVSAEAALPVPDGGGQRRGRRHPAAGHDRALPDQLQLQGPAGPDRAHPCRCRRRGPDPDPAAQGQGRPGDHHGLHRRKGGTGPQRRRGPSAALRRVRPGRCGS